MPTEQTIPDEKLCEKGFYSGNAGAYISFHT